MMDLFLFLQTSSAFDPNQIVNFYEDAIDWGIEASFRVLAYLAILSLFVSLFKGG